MNDQEQIKRAAAYWNSVSSQDYNALARWWARPSVRRSINRRVCGEPLPGLHEGFHMELRKRLGNESATKAISVGCGAAQKEISLVRLGLVQQFHLFEISSERIARGQELAEKCGVQDRVHFHLADAFTLCTDTDFDLVYWNNALHHMMDTAQAVRWSRDRLLPGGLFAMDDFVGANRFQWSDRALGWANRFRASLSDVYFEDHKTGTTIPRAVQRYAMQQMIEMDPSEAADSENILPSIKSFFTAPEIQMTGGAIYSLGLNRILANFDDVRDEEALNLALLLDEALSDIGENNYAVVFARKDA